jgi:N-acetylated-alpha-linked acidic dipeptidase
MVSLLLKFESRYLNSDIGVEGTHFAASASPLLASVMMSAASFVLDPDSNSTLSEIFKFRPAPRGDLEVLGSGSDFTSFLDHLGIPSCNYGFYFDQSSGVYHSAYDDLFWMNRFGSDNRTYKYYVALAQFSGSLILELSFKYVSKRAFVFPQVFRSGF